MIDGIRLILCDVDFTLLNSRRQMLPETAAAIHKLKEKGIRFGIASGRSCYALERLLEDWHLEQDTDVLLGFNGEMIRERNTETVLEDHALDGRYLKEIRELLKGYEHNICIFDRYEAHVLRADAEAVALAGRNRLKLAEDDLTQYETRPVPKVLCMFEPEELDRFMAENHPESSDWYMVRSTDRLLEFMNPKASKGQGIQKILDLYGLQPDQILVFGDEMNDLDMFERYAGVAMGNATQRIRELARYHTLDCDHNGVGDFIEKHLL